MGKRANLVGLFCIAAGAVYSGRANPIGAAVSTGAPAGNTAAGRVRLIDEPAVAPAPSPAPAAPVIGAPPDVPTPQPAPATPVPILVPARAGTSVSDTQVSVSDAGTVEMHVNDASLLEVLRLLSLRSQRNIIATKSVTGTISANLYNVTVREALDAILQGNGFVYRERGNFIYVYTAKELADLDRAARQMTTRVFHLYYTPAANAVNMIKPVLSPDAQLAFTAPATVGIDQSGTKDTGGNSHATEDTIVVTDYTDNLDRATKVLKEVDRRPQQILIEATILSAALSDDNSLGVDFAVLGGVNFNQMLAGPASTVAGAAAGTLTTAGGAGVGNYGVGSTNFTSALPPGGLRVGYLSNSVSVFVQALEQVTNTVVLSNPKVLVVDKQKGEVIVGRQDGYLTSTVTETASIQTVQFLDTGTRLIFRPFIGNDGFVRMEIHPEDSSGGLTSANLPFKVTTEVTSNMMVKDGHTIVIGGLFRESTDATRGQIPLLGDIPFLGVLFRQQRDISNREEVIILLTPHIVKDDSAYADVSAEQLKRAEEYRVGARKGMMFFGRERLAESAYENAQAELNKPHPDRGLAMWHLNAATNLNPAFIEAIDLKEKVSGQQVTDVDNSSIRRFVSQSILADPGAPRVTPATADVGMGQTASPSAPNATRPAATVTAVAPDVTPAK